MMITLTALLMLALSAKAMSYEQARDQALFLTDKMAYELNLTEDQYEAAYEINLDYLMGINDYNELYGTYWERRNLDLSYVLLDWQYRAYLDAAYFYRPLYWDAGYWHFAIYARYPHRTWFYFGRPAFYFSYHGGHSWHHNGGRSWYHGRRYGHSHHVAHGTHGHGMRNSYDRGDYNDRRGHYDRGRGNRGLERRNDNGRGRDMARGNDRSVNSRQTTQQSDRTGRFGGRRESSTRHNEATRGSSVRPSTSRDGFRGERRSDMSLPNRTFTPSRSSSATQQQRSTERMKMSEPQRRSSDIQRQSTSPSRSYSNPSRSYSAPSQRSSSTRSISAPSRSYSSPRSSMSGSHSSAPRSSSFGGGHSGGSRMGSGGSSHSGGSRGGGSFGGRR